MKCQAVILFLILSIYASAEEISEIPCDDDEITTMANIAMVGDINNKGRRYNVAVFEEVDGVKENNKNLADEGENEKPPPLSSRNIRSFDLYDDLYDSYRRKNIKDNKNIDPKNLLNDIRSRNSQSNTYDEDQQRRMFFSKIFSLFDDDKNLKKSGKSEDKSKRSKSHGNHEVDMFKTFMEQTEKTSSGQNKHDLHKKTSLKGKEIEPVNESFESTIQSLLNDRIKSNNSDNDENVTKHRRKNKGRRQARRNNSRPERQLGDTESYENVESQTQDDSVDQKFISDLITIKNRKYSVSQGTLVNNYASSTESIPKIVNEKENSRRAYLIRTPSFNYYQTDVTYPIADSRSVEGEDDTVSRNNVNSMASKEDLGKEVSNEPVDSFFNTSHEDNDEEHVTFNPDTRRVITDKQNIESVHQKEDMNVVIDDSSKDKEKPSNELVANNQSHGPDVPSPKLTDLHDKKTRRINYINVRKETNSPNEIATIKEEIETPEQELQLSKVYGDAGIVAYKNNALNPLSAHIKLDLLIQFPSQINGNEN